MDMREDYSGMFDLEGKRRSFQGVYNVTAVVHAAGGEIRTRDTQEYYTKAFRNIIRYFIANAGTIQGQKRERAKKATHPI